MPADSNSLILAMNNGNPMAPKLMYEFPRAAMIRSSKKGRNFLGQFLTKLYGETEWTRAAVHDWLAEWKPSYVIDINRDTQLQDSYAMKNIRDCRCRKNRRQPVRFKIYHFDAAIIFEIPQEQVDSRLPILLNPWVHLNRKPTTSLRMPIMSIT